MTKHTKAKLTKMALTSSQQILLDKAYECFTRWKDFDTNLRDEMHSRGANFPSVVSEIIACAAFGLSWPIVTAGDAKDLSKNVVYEIKATSAKGNDLSSFSPNEKFDDLLFCKYDRGKEVVYIYDTKKSRDDMKEYVVNKKKNETFESQALSGRRPRMSIESKIINKEKLKPSYEAHFSKDDGIVVYKSR